MFVQYPIGIVHKDQTALTAITAHFQQDKHKNNQNSSTILVHVKENMKYNHSQNSLTNIHMSSMKMCWPKKASITKQKFHDTYLHYTSLAVVVGHWSHSFLLT